MKTNLACLHYIHKVLLKKEPGIRDSNPLHKQPVVTTHIQTYAYTFSTTVHTYVHTYVCTYVCMYVCMYVRFRGELNTSLVACSPAKKTTFHSY